MTESPKAKMSSLTSYVWFPVSLCDSWVARLFPGTAFVVVVRPRLVDIYTEQIVSLYQSSLLSHTSMSINLEILLQPQAELW